MYTKWSDDEYIWLKYDYTNSLALTNVMRHDKMQINVVVRRAGFTARVLWTYEIYNTVDTVGELHLAVSAHTETAAHSVALLF